jgi:glycerol-3-phosphate dehydrogenase
LFKSSIAWNVLFKKKAVSSYALAVIPPRKANAQTYFLLPWKGRLLAGTGHAPWNLSSDNIFVSEEMIRAFIEDLNMAMPSLKLKPEHIDHVFTGLLPVSGQGDTDLSKREVIYDHGRNGGTDGLYSVSGVKFTTSRLVAEKTLNIIFARGKLAKEKFHPGQLFSVSNQMEKRGIFKLNHQKYPEKEQLENKLLELAECEAVCHLDDLIIRRTNLWEAPEMITRISTSIQNIFNWSEVRLNDEIERLKQAGVDT